MKLKTLLLLFCLVLTAGLVDAARAGDQVRSYVEPSLRQAETDSLAVIVTTGDSRQAAELVERVGGQVSSELWLIDAVAATIPANQLQALAAMPEVRTIVENKGVEAAGGPMDGEGWVTPYRFPVPWDGSPDVQSTKQASVYKSVYPVAIDRGTDL